MRVDRQEAVNIRFVYAVCIMANCFQLFSMLLDLIHSFSHSQSQFLEQKSLLTKLSLINCNLTVFSCGRLGEAIGPNRFLSTVVLDSNKFGTAGAVALCVGLGESDASLHTLSISKNFWTAPSF